MRIRSILLIAATVTFALASSAQPVILHYTVSMDHPESHRYHVVLKATGFKGPGIDLRMPGWMPGYYQMLDYAKNVSGLRALGEGGQALSMEKTDRDAWRVAF